MIRPEEEREGWREGRKLRSRRKAEWGRSVESCGSWKGRERTAAETAMGSGDAMAELGQSR